MSTLPAAPVRAPATLGGFERYLTVWIALAMLALSLIHI